MRRGETSSANKPHRKTIEKNRREEMKALCSKLVSLIPAHHFNPPKESLSQQDQIQQAANYIKILRGRVEELRTMKIQALMKNPNNARNHPTNSSVANNIGESKLPILAIKELGSELEVVLITGLKRNFMLHQVIVIIEQEGAQVVTVGISTIGDNIFHTLHAQVIATDETFRCSARYSKLLIAWTSD